MTGRGNSHAGGTTIPSIDETYTDRFGHEWSIRAGGKRGVQRRYTFTCGPLRLIAVAQDAAGGPQRASNRTKELFCDAERVLRYGTETWYVGYRKRMGRGGRVQGGVYTRFRSESGELRYARTMLCFRHMSEAALCQHLVAAERARS